ncbi:ATP-dependent DNA helicase PIF1-like [Pistacia vera]|uniref:ATP-dependent DNA helicase PIF1-like n=1 Tax=Pistacia vera TaxID=55513 RepID=UPI0012638D28|nr:ATP-dependent DNA helicase PIF1-like [Pistacia vera]
MRLKTNLVNPIELENLKTFDKWLLDIGEGRDVVEDESYIQILEDLKIDEHTSHEEAIMNAVFPDLSTQINNIDYMRERERARAILTPKNETIHRLNDYITQSLPTDGKTYFSLDCTCKAAGISNDDEILYPTEFLNSMMCSDMPKHELHMKIGIPIMLLRNLNQYDGLCNGNKLIITHLEKWSIQAVIITGSNIRDIITIPRIIMSKADMKWPFRLRRRQLPMTVSFCMTINKSQGQSLKTVGLYMKHQVFTHGQLYVAQSRVTSRQGIKILLALQQDEPTETLTNIVFKEVFN